MSYAAPYIRDFFIHISQRLNLQYWFAYRRTNDVKREEISTPSGSIINCLNNSKFANSKLSAHHRYSWAKAIGQLIAVLGLEATKNFALSV
jgi:hypothetical protein